MIMNVDFPKTLGQIVHRWSRRSQGEHDLVLTLRNEGNGLVTGMALLPFCPAIQSESDAR